MVAPSAKRARRLIIHSSDEEDAKEKRPKRGHTLNSKRAETSDNKARVAEKDTKLKPIYTFFNNLAEQEPGQHGDTEDLIDDSLDEELLLLDAPKNPQTSLPAPRPDLSSNASPKFLKSINNTKPVASRNVKVTPTSKEGDTRPWVERFAPVSIEELAVHKRKVSDVREWLGNALAGNGHKRLLILRGPSGSGKTTTVTLLSQALDLDLQEWQNPIGTKSASERMSSMSAQFEDFIERSGRFGKLSISSSSGEAEHTGQEISSSSSDCGRRKAIIIEEFPNTFTRSSDALQYFRNTILQYLASNTPTSAAMPSSFTPLIMIISETLLTTTTAITDSFTAHRLLGPQILNHPGASIIDFNPVAVTIIMKALELIIQKEARASGRKNRPGDALVRKLSELGDLRSAVSSLEFICVRGDKTGDWGAKTALHKSKKSKGSAELTVMERDSLEIITQREASLDIFHAVGKVVYNKRDEVLVPGPGAIRLIPRPEHLSQYERPKRSQVSVENLFDEIGTDTQTFIAALHENYLLSCNSLECVDACVDALGETDLLSLSSNSGSRSAIAGGGGFRGSFQGAGSDSLRQDEISFQIAVRGILFSLPSPVSRDATTYSVRGAGSSRSSGGKSDAFKMLYPTSTRIWRQAQEIESLVELLTLRMAQAIASPEAQGHNNDQSENVGVEGWKSNAQAKFGASTAQQRRKVERQWLAVIGGSSARREMILERLPYMAKIERGRSNPTISLPDIEKVVLFRSGTCQEDGVPEDEDGFALTALWATDREGDHTLPSWKPMVPQSIVPEPKGQGGLSLRLPVDTAAQKMVLSDDDIEDD